MRAALGALALVVALAACTGGAKKAAPTTTTAPATTTTLATTTTVAPEVTTTTTTLPASADLGWATQPSVEALGQADALAWWPFRPVLRDVAGKGLWYASSEQGGRSTPPEAGHLVLWLTKAVSPDQATEAELFADGALALQLTWSTSAPPTRSGRAVSVQGARGVIRDVTVLESPAVRLAWTVPATSRTGDPADTPGSDGSTTTAAPGSAGVVTFELTGAVDDRTLLATANALVAA